jgi:hypothetical protein
MPRAPLFLLLAAGAAFPATANLNDFSGLELFLDDGMVSWTRNLRRQLLQPVKDPGNPVVRSEHPWESEFTTIHGTVMWDPGRNLYRMWYNAFGPDYRNQQYLAYAESTDGVAWRKPLFDFVPFEGRKTNLLLGGDVNIHGPCLLLNPGASEAERYLLLFDSYTAKRPGSPESKLAGRAVYAATSPDGIRFTPPKGRVIVLGKSDTGHSAVWNPERGRFQAFLRGVNEYADDGGQRQRVRYVRLAESADGKEWTQPIELMKSDEADGAPDAQMHQFTVTRYGNVYIALLTLFRIENLELDAEHRAETGLRLEHGVTDTQLAVSRDGLHWTRVAGRQTFLPLGAPSQWDGGWIVTASGMVVRENRVRIYYGGSNGRYGKKTEIGMASFPLDRFVAMKPARLNAEGILELKPYWYRGGDVTLNASVFKGGEIRAELLDFDGNVMKGFEKAASVPLRADTLKHALRWAADGRERSLPEVAGRALRLRFYIRNAALHSLRYASNTFGMER